MFWISLITSLPTENTTVRMRAWRALKASGAAVLRDGVYVLPETGTCRATLDGLAADVRDAGGTALVLRMEEPPQANFRDLFDRSVDYAALLAEVARVRQALGVGDPPDALKQARKLRKALGSLGEIDFFPGEARRQAEAAVVELELACARAAAPDEPRAVEGPIARLALADHQGRSWATRQRPWVDRLASPWLIQRFIDRPGRLRWLGDPPEWPPRA